MINQIAEVIHLSPGLTENLIYTAIALIMLFLLKVPYEFGAARFDELAKGGIPGLESGYLKILFDPETLKILGIRIIGESTTELIHTGQAVLSLGGTMEYFRDSVFNYPTLAEAYKVAALDGLNKL